MNTTDAEIAGKLDGIKCGSFAMHQTAECLYLDKAGYFISEFIEQPKDLLAFCRAVVSKIDGEKYTMDEMQIYAKEYAECGRMNTSDPSVHQEGVGTSSEEAHGIIRGTT